MSDSVAATLLSRIALEGTAISAMAEPRPFGIGPAGAPVGVAALLERYPHFEVQARSERRFLFHVVRTRPSEN
jgi:hypothetical protein